MENITDKSSQGKNESHLQNRPQKESMAHIKGWGVDINPKNDPTYPMRQRLNEDSKSNDWERPSQQVINTEVLHSIERPNLTSVFGTSAPPAGLSGILRRFAFKFSEGRMGHWLSLLLADRVNVVEGLVMDIAKGQVPNVFAESGVKAQWQHNRKAVVTKVAVGVAIATAVAVILHRRGKSSVNDDM
ncbi:MAG: hypothetical protein V4660_18340 [Pseudomonadota bacterium]